MAFLGFRLIYIDISIYQSIILTRREHYENYHEA